MHRTAITTIRDGLNRYANQVKRSAELAATTNAQPEDQLKPVVSDLVKAIGDALKIRVEATTESRIDEIGRPDLAILKDGLLIGYIELKAPDVDIARLRGRDALQFKRFRMIPNLIYTNGSDWMFYRRGETDEESKLQRPYTVRMDNLLEDGAKAVGEDHPQDFVDLFREFLDWRPIVPRTAKGLAEQLAPLTRLLRDEVTAAVHHEEGKALKSVYEDWKRTLFPEASASEFADSYAQTVTYGLLLARLSGSHVLSTQEAAQAIAKRSGLLARTLEVLTQQGTREELGVAIELLERSIDAVSSSALAASDENTDPWLYFYEDFLAVYDPELRNRRGVYYTPAQLVQAQVRLVDDILRTHLGRPDGIAADDVTILDPALGTGTYLLTALQYGAEKGAERWGTGAKGSTATKMAQNLFGFELLVGPYAVAHVRLTQLLKELGGEEHQEGMQVYLTDTLESPTLVKKIPHSFYEKPLADEAARARQIKASQSILVCIGNPPYERDNTGDSDEDRQRRGGWITQGDSKHTHGLFNDFVRSAKFAGHGDALQPLRNSYVYFWRWALWKAVEQTDSPGIVSFITASSYLSGRAFGGMRQRMREVFDHIWILDLGGDSLGARVSENVFDIRTPVAIAIGVSTSGVNHLTPSTVHYARVEGSRVDKLSVLGHCKELDHFNWIDASSGWLDSFIPEIESRYSEFSRLTSLFPWTLVGPSLHRRWPVAESDEVLMNRWKALMSSEDRGGLFSETRDRKVSKEYRNALEDNEALPSIHSLPLDAPPPKIVDYGFRTFDLQRIFRDTRLADFCRPALWRSMSTKQIFGTSLTSRPLGYGSAFVTQSAIPDQHAFSNRGERDIIPLYRDAAATQPNITSGLLDHLQSVLDITFTPEDLMAYVAGIMGSPAYTSTFEEELATPGPRIPITKDGDLFQRVADIGKQVIAWQTYARRFPEAIGTSHAHVPQGSASVKVAIPETPEKYPESISDVVYNENTRELKVGEGVIENVVPKVFNYEVSGFKVVRSWLGYRVKNRAGRKSSPLDDIRPEHWTWEITQNCSSCCGQWRAW